jgi:hypothetical protein
VVVRVSRLAKALLWISLVVGIFVWLILVDLGVNAGRIHYGVSVMGGAHIGGMTEVEAAEYLERREVLLTSRQVVFGARELGEVSFYPYDVGWKGHPATTARVAMTIGRSGGPFAALGDRIDAWAGGIKLKWEGHANPVKVTAIIDKLAARAAGRGLTLNAPKFRSKIKRALVTWPRRPWYRIPIEDQD